METIITKRSVAHATFTIERVYDASPARVFQAFADQKAKTRWFAGGEGWETAEYSLDLREGGREVWRGRPTGGPEIRNNTIFHDVVLNEGIVSTYEMYLGEAQISVSLATVQFRPEGAGTRLIFTEQGTFLDGSDDGSMREHGTRELLEALAAELRRETVGA